MAKDEKSLLEELDRILRSDEIRAQIQRVVERVRKDLTRKKKAVMAWEPVPLQVFGGGLPPEIQSSWVFILRAGANTGAERHPNSHQRMMTLEGTGDMQTEKRERWQQPSKQTSNAEPIRQAQGGLTSNVEIKEGKAGPSQPPSLGLRRATESAVSGQTSDVTICWQSNILVSDPDVPLDEQWISIPPNVWHQPVVATGTDWVVVSFHTVPAEELIEERPGSGEGGTKQMRYLGKRGK